MQYRINPSLKQLNNHWVFLYEFLSWRYRLLVFPLLIQGTWSSIGLWMCGCVLRGADGSVSSGVSLSILCSGPFPIRKPCLGGGQAAGLQVAETGKLACRKVPAPGIWPLSTFGGNSLWGLNVRRLTDGQSGPVLLQLCLFLVHHCRLQPCRLDGQLPQPWLFKYSSLDGAEISSCLHLALVLFEPGEPPYNSGILFLDPGCFNTSGSHR